MLAEPILEVIKIYRQNTADCEVILKTMTGLNHLLQVGDQGSTEKDFTALTAQREEIFLGLKKRTDNLPLIKQKICSAIGIFSWQTEKLKPYLDDDLYRELFLATQMFQEKLGKVLQMDEIFLPRLKGQLTNIKDELYKIRNSKTGKNAYQRQRARGAHFIDKKK